MSGQTALPQPTSGADLEALPKAELHLHLRGAIPAWYLRQQFRKYRPAEAIASAPPKQLAWMLAHPGVRRIVHADDPQAEIDSLFCRASFQEFLGAYLFTGYFVRRAEDFRNLVHAVRSELRGQNIVYAEVTVSLPEYMQQGIELADLLDVLAEDPAEPPRVHWIVDPVRSFGPKAATSLVERILHHRPQSVIGLTLGGAEHLHPPAPFQRAYQIAREGGLRTTIHAGEALGPGSVWDAVRILEVERVGHGVRAVEDLNLVRHLAERGIPLEICPTSNVCTGIYPSLEDHPVRDLFEAGVPLSVSTDDPSFFRISLARELANLRQIGFSWPEIGAVANNAFSQAFEPTVAKNCRVALPGAVGPVASSSRKPPRAPESTH